MTQISLSKATALNTAANPMNRRIAACFSDTKPRPSPDRDIVDQDPGERQKENQDEKDDPLAA
ncbi:MAG TPA: hypothetical protein VKW78_04020 [Terriglobales bacterium]|nr:hypothetical protein [Terriglobales bacterium]